jgi:hypothetical protein
MALLTKDPWMMRRGALLMMLAVPFLLYAAYFRRGDPFWAGLSVVVALSLLAFCLWVLRRASQLQR